MKNICTSFLLFVPCLTLAEPSGDETPIDVTPAMIAKYQEIQALPHDDSIFPVSHLLFLSPQPGDSSGKAVLYMRFIDGGGFGEEFTQKWSRLLTINNMLQRIYQHQTFLNNKHGIGLSPHFSATKISGLSKIIEQLQKSFESKRSPEEIRLTISGIQEKINANYENYEDGDFKDLIEIHNKYLKNVQ